MLARGLARSVKSANATPLLPLHCASALRVSGDTTPCKMTGVTLHSHVRYK